MLSNKMTVSLMSLIIITALAFVVPSAMAAKIKVTVEGRTSVSYAVDSNGDATDTVIPLTVITDQDVAAPTLTIKTFGKDGIEITSSAATIAADSTADNTGKRHYYNITVPSGLATDANLPLRLVVTVPSVDHSDPTVDADASDATYRTITVTKYQDTSDLPKVVSVQRLRPGSQTVVAAFQEEVVTDFSFDVRFVLSEAHSEYDGGKTPDENAKRLIEVSNGVPGNLVVGVPFSRIGNDEDPVGTITTAERAQTILPHPIEGMYWHDASAANGLGGVPRPTHTDANAALAAGDLIPLPTGTDNMYRQYRVTIYPNQRKGDSSKTFDVKIKVKNFHDGGSPVRNTYISPGFGESANLPNGREILTVKVAYTEVALRAGYRVTLPEKLRIPAGGYLVIVQNYDGSEVIVPAGSKEAPPKSRERTPVQMIYNVHEMSTLPNLATQFLRGVVIDVESARDHPLIITEVMWGEDASLVTSSNSQYIELYNAGSSDYITANDDLATPYWDESLTLVFYAPNEFDYIPVGGEYEEGFVVDESGEVLGQIPDWWGEIWFERPNKLPWNVSDRIGTLGVEKGDYWSPVGIGQSGRSGKQALEGELTTGRGPFEDSVKIVSMYRSMDADGKIQNGQMKSSWLSSEGPKSANFKDLAIGVRHGTPGAATESIETPADAEAEAKAKEAKAKAAADKIASTGTYPQKGDGRVYISEIMFAGGGRLPQWIEISNGDRLKEFNLSGWTLTVDNAATDTDVDVATATFTIPNGTTIAPSKPHNPAGDNTPSTILVVTETGRNSFTRPKEAAQIINLAVDNEVELITAGVLKGKYTLLSAEAFMITLAPPVPTAEKAPAGETAAAKTIRLANTSKEAALRKAAIDMVGNLGKDWTLKTNEDGARSSIIRGHVEVVRGPAAPEDGMMEENWVLASDTSFANVPLQVSSYYGALSDLGTPGFRAGGALPVELSHFRPTRDKATGQVVITWATQSELNNAGFFIKRSQQRNGEFKVINATIIAGAGTTSEKQFYTFTDTTAQPNVVYYYQIEDVSLDGNRQTLTRGIRLKGHVGAAGKATTLWGELKSSNE